MPQKKGNTHKINWMAVLPYRSIRKGGRAFLVRWTYNRLLQKFVKTFTLSRYSQNLGLSWKTIWKQKPFNHNARIKESFVGESIKEKIVDV